MDYVIDNRPLKIPFKSDDILERTIQNAKNLLMTRMGEIPYDRLRGFDPTLYDLPIGELRAELPAELDRVMMWEPDVNVKSSTCYLDNDNETVIEVTLEIGEEA